jgi:hypothetical protein
MGKENLKVQLARVKERVLRASSEPLLMPYFLGYESPFPAAKDM